MGKGKTGMNEVSVYMNACVRVWKESEKGELATYLACVSDFTTMFICIILIVNLPSE